MTNYKQIIIIFVLFLYLTGCSRYVSVKIPCPQPPKVKPVNVINGTISGSDLDAVIENWLEINAYVKEISKLGCTTP